MKFPVALLECLRVAGLTRELGDGRQLFCNGSLEFSQFGFERRLVLVEFCYCCVLLKLLPVFVTQLGFHLDQFFEFVEGHV